MCPRAPRARTRVNCTRFLFVFARFVIVVCACLRVYRAYIHTRKLNIRTGGLTPHVFLSGLPTAAAPRAATFRPAHAGELPWPINAHAPRRSTRTKVRGTRRRRAGPRPFTPVCCVCCVFGLCVCAWVLCVWHCACACVDERGGGNAGRKRRSGCLNLGGCASTGDLTGDSPSSRSRGPARRRSRCP